MSSPQTSDLRAVVDALGANDRFLVTSHENPDGDALGSLLAATLGLRQLGKDVAMYLYGDAPLPTEYGFMPLDELARRPPADAGDRVLVAVDCAKADRLRPDPTVLDRPPPVIHRGHHHHNTRVRQGNLILPHASSHRQAIRAIL